MVSVEFDSRLPHNLSRERERKNIMTKKTLTKSDFVEVVAAQEGIETKKAAKRAIEAFINGVKSVLGDNNDLVLSGFGKFTVEHKETEKRFFGITQDVIEVPAHNLYKAKLSKTLIKNK
ncbi:HU family DNA-binding protein [Limosilactobacillus reuteri]|uniref:DNA-binding protein HU n=2 Tax=Limosilactobacillus reuteri TaxID=1598 RepID=A0ABD6Y6V8_LIMRT|nr:HU family DNA-binding protein [Limosilactobacillus reuteri]